MRPRLDVKRRTGRADEGVRRSGYLNTDVTLDVDGVVRWRIETSRTARNSMQNVPGPSGNVMTAILRVDEDALDQ